MAYHYLGRSIQKAKNSTGFCWKCPQYNRVYPLSSKNKPRLSWLAPVCPSFDRAACRFADSRGCQTKWEGDPLQDKATWHLWARTCRSNTKYMLSQTLNPQTTKSR